MDKLSPEQERANELFLRELGMGYEEFLQLDFDEQQKLLTKNRKKKFVKSKGRNWILIGSGIYRIGDSPEKYRKRKEDQFDNIMYSKPVAFVKKLTRKITKR